MKTTKNTAAALRRHHLCRALAWRKVAQVSSDDRALGLAYFWNAAHRALANHAKDGDSRDYRAAVRNAFGGVREPEPSTFVA